MGPGRKGDGDEGISNRLIQGILAAVGSPNLSDGEAARGIGHLSTVSEMNCK